MQPAARSLCSRAVPNLPFFEGTFDLALCSHFLFLYSEHHDAQFHIQALRELCRVAQEVRVFPLLELSGAPSRHLPEVVSALQAGGCNVSIEPVSYEFQKAQSDAAPGRRMIHALH